MELNDGEYVMLQGRKHPLWKGVLRVALENGLTELSVRLIQAPSDENGGMAISQATAEFKGADGQLRRFVEIGDCDGSNCGKMIAPHRIRMSATRAKGRALRDALGIGEAMAEEMSDLPREPDETARKAGYVGGPAYAQEPSSGPSAVAKHWPNCKTCNFPMSEQDMQIWRPHAKLLKDVTFCMSHISQAVKVAEHKATEKPAEDPYTCNRCNAPVKDAVGKATLQQFGEVLCRSHVQEAAALATARVPAGRIG